MKTILTLLFSLSVLVTYGQDQSKITNARIRNTGSMGLSVVSLTKADSTAFQGAVSTATNAQTLANANTTKINALSGIVSSLTGTSGSAVATNADWVINAIPLQTINPLLATGVWSPGSTNPGQYVMVATQDAVITKVAFRVSAAATTAVANSGSNVANGIVLTDYSGNVLAWVSTTASITVAANAALTLSNTVNITAGTRYIVYFRFEGTGSPTIQGSTLGYLMNNNIAASPYRLGYKSNTAIVNTGTITGTGWTAVTQIPTIQFY